MPSFLNDNACKTSVEAFVKESLLLSEDLFNLEEVHLYFTNYTTLALTYCTVPSIRPRRSRHAASQTAKT